jgi:hypothetical protein
VVVFGGGLSKIKWGGGTSLSAHISFFSQVMQVASPSISPLNPKPTNPINQIDPKALNLVVMLLPFCSAQNLKVSHLECLKNGRQWYYCKRGPIKEGPPNKTTNKN